MSLMETRITSTWYLDKWIKWRRYGARTGVSGTKLGFVISVSMSVEIFLNGGDDEVHLLYMS